MSDKELLTNKSSTLMGIIIGIVLGVLMSLAVVWYISENNSFQARKAVKEAIVPAEPLPLPGKPGDQPIGPGDKLLPNDTAAPTAASPTTPPVAAPATPTIAAPATPTITAPVSPQPQPVTPQSLKPLATKPVASPATGASDAAAKNSNLSPSAGANTLIYFQAGAFEDEKRADALRATLALAQLESRVKVDRITGRGLIYRVQLGPYDSAAAANVRRQLEDQGLHPVVVRDN